MGKKTVSFTVVVCIELLVLCALTGLFIVVTIQGRSNLENLLTNSSFQILEAKAETINEIIRSYQKLLGTLARQEIFMYGSHQLVEAAAYGQVGKVGNDIPSVFVVWPDGRATTTPGNYIDIADRAYIQSVYTGEQDSAFSEPLISRNTGRPALILVHAVKHPGGGIRLLLGIEMSLDRIDTAIREISMGLVLSSNAWIADKNGMIFSSQLPELKIRVNLLRADVEAGYRGLSALAQAILDQKVFTGTFKHLDGRNYTVFSREISEATGWRLGIVLSTERLMQPLDSLTLVLAGVMVTALGASLLAAVYIGKLHNVRSSLIRAKEEAVAGAEAKSLFLARMSHEIRTPLNAVLGLSELAAMHCGKEQCTEYIAGIKQAGANLLSIINDILDFSKIESGRMEISRAPYQTASLLNDVLMIIKVRLMESPLRFEIDLDESIPAFLVGDEMRVRQVLLNLLSNAVKYTRKGFIWFSARYEPVAPETARLTFTVADSGIGIKPENLTRLFGDFVRINQKYNKAIEGTGLGLAIARSLCRAMDGDIRVESEYGVGSIFTATLTQGVADAAPMGPLSNRIAGNTPARDIRFTAPDFRVLIVDDMETNLAVAEGLLAPYGMKITACRSGEDALARIEADAYDLVLMDHMMPGMDGVETTRAVRAMPDERCRTMPVVALTANAVSGMREMFLENGFNDFIAKPIEVPKLDALLKKWIPVEQRRETAPADELTRKTAMPAVTAFPDMAGVDVAAGVARIGGSLRLYTDLLKVFRRDAETAFALLAQVPDASSLSAFTTQVHALKSALASVGAGGLSQLAALLEKAGREADIAAIGRHLASFREQLAALVARIDDVVRQATTAADHEDGTAPPDPEIRTLLAQLRDALEAVDIEAADAALARLQILALPETMRNAVFETAEMMLEADFQKATARVNALLKQVA
ncbi:MAG: response regulator [Desulfovibrio sp.]|jgi:signal transduction histidine kinase/FixJ family two-component response regulator/HPt (histidine-containing phosphotransfer) domain-containing protein|nr:response regulator [Desulfovibrio sp.]